MEILTPSKLHFYAVGIKSGGGKLILETIFSELKRYNIVIYLSSDLLTYLKDTIKSSDNITVKEYPRNLRGRLLSMMDIYKSSVTGETVFVFDGSPIKIKNDIEKIVFLQNALHIESFPLRDFRFITKGRIKLERFLHKFFYNGKTKYIVQTNSMKARLTKWISNINIECENEILILPVFELNDKILQSNIDESIRSSYFYPSDCSPYKNHKNLILAWIELAKFGFYPNLILTIENPPLEIELLLNKALEFGCLIDNRGTLHYKEVLDIYKSVKAIIFPSFIESFGLPLVEAHSLSVPILASELDYVRDVCEPSETFDPNSERSIMRSVLRHENISIDLNPTVTARDFFFKSI